VTVDGLMGSSLAMAEMTTLTAAIYRMYRTRVKFGTEDTSPGITSRFEVFYDETMPRMRVRSSLTTKRRGLLTFTTGTCMSDRFRNTKAEWRLSEGIKSNQSQF
jgi:hypothetical protein